MTEKRHGNETTNKENTQNRNNSIRKENGSNKKDNPSVGPCMHLPVKHTYHVAKNLKKDEKLGTVQDDPRGSDPDKRITKKASKNGKGRNTESFDPASTLVRPDLRVHVGSPFHTTFSKKLKHDDVVIVPELFGKEDDWSIYYKLIDEMSELQRKNKRADWISWHEGAHLISKDPKGSKTFDDVIEKLCTYFNISNDHPKGTRFNWYRDSSDWKPFHHDSAAFNPQRAKSQNITVGVSFGATRELAFIRAVPLQHGNGHKNNSDSKDNDEIENKVKLYFPQTNNGVFSFGRDANILWKHGINALHPDDQDGKGRISIILWGYAQGVIEEDGSPKMLGQESGHGGGGTGFRGSRGGRGGRGRGKGNRGGRGGR